MAFFQWKILWPMGQKDGNILVWSMPVSANGNILRVKKITHLLKKSFFHTPCISFRFLTILQILSLNSSVTLCSCPSPKCSVLPFLRNSSYVPTTRALRTFLLAFQTLTGRRPPWEWLLPDLLSCKSYLFQVLSLILVCCPPDTSMGKVGVTIVT